MRRVYTTENGSSEVIYAESLSRLLQQNHFSFLNDYPSVLFVTTQRFYEVYYDKFSSLFESNTFFNWYICPNSNEIHSVRTYEKVVSYIEEMKLPANTMLIGAGNEKIHYLCGFLRRTSLYIENYLFLPTTMTAFIEALKAKGKLINSQHTLTSELYALPERLIYDTMLIELEAKESWFSDYFELLNLSLFFNKELFQLLSQMPQKNQQAWTPYVDLVMDSLEKEPLRNDLTVMAITKSFYQLTESHYMTLREKEQVSFLLYFLWCLKKGAIEFSFPVLINWLTTIMPTNLVLPTELNTYELAESITKELNRYNHIVGLSDIGVCQLVDMPTMKEIYHVIETYREI